METFDEKSTPGGTARQKATMKRRTFASALRGASTSLHFYRRLGFGRLILSAGMPRSGSTLLFNILRLILQSDRRCNLSSGWIEELKDCPHGHTYLVKTHTIRRMQIRRASLAFYSYRDVRDAIVSSSRKFNSEPSIDLVRAWISQFELARENVDMMLRYEDMMQDLPGTIEEIAKKMDVGVDVDAVARKIPSQFDGTDATRNGHSKTTLLHNDHITGTVAGEWREIIAPDLQKQIHAEFGWWFEQNGYERTPPRSSRLFDIPRLN